MEKTYEYQAVEISTWDNKTYLFKADQARQIIEGFEAKEKSAIMPNGMPLVFGNVKSFDLVDLPDEAAVLELPPGLVATDQERSELQQAWSRIIRLNLGRVMEKKNPYDRVPLLKSLDDLEHLDRTGEWPTYVPVAEWPSRLRKPQTVAMAWMKRTVTEQAFMKHYLGHPGYYRLDSSGGDVTLAFWRPKRSPLPRHLSYCTPDEIEVVLGRIRDRRDD